MTTATVETLTAEVRTLIVGTRQVTLSVAKQLDWVPLAELEVMGRVRVGSRSDLVIGKHRPTGVLALATYDADDARRRPPASLYITARHLPDGRFVTICDSKRDTNHQENTFTFEGRKFHLDTFTRWVSSGVYEFTNKAVRGCGIDGHTPNGGGRCEHWLTNGLDDIIRAELDDQQTRHDTRVALNVAAATSPLIVLAGLR